MIKANADFKLINDAFPHIGKKLQLYWGQPEFNTYVEGLQSDTSGTSRAGFPGAILMAILSLARAHDVAYPHLIHQPADIWGR